MKKITIGNTKLEVPEVALGCMRITGLKDEKEREALLNTALELGVNFFDHADIYDAGHAEEVFGEMIESSMREQVIIFILLRQHFSCCHIKSIPLFAS